MPPRAQLERWSRRARPIWTRSPFRPGRNPLNRRTRHPLSRRNSPCRFCDLKKRVAAAAAATPNLYLDLRTYYTTVPTGSLSLGFSNSALFATLPNLATLSALTTFADLVVAGKPEH